MDRGKNCKIGWMIQKDGVRVRIILEEQKLLYQRREIGETGYRVSVYSVKDRRTIGEMYRLYPHHPILRTLMTTPSAEQVERWDGLSDGERAHRKQMNDYRS